MSEENLGAEEFLRGEDGKVADKAEASFEAGCVRAILRRFQIQTLGWDLSDGLRFSLFDENCPGFPVRLAARRSVGRRVGKKSTKISQKAFYELEINELFDVKKLKASKMVDEWEAMKADQSLDGRPVGVVFRCIGTAYVMHDWDPAAEDSRTEGIRLLWTRSAEAEDGSGRKIPYTIVVEPLGGLLNRAVKEWSPPE